MKKTSIIAVLMAVTVTVTAHADVTLHGLYTDHVVLQRDMPVAVYGSPYVPEHFDMPLVRQFHEPDTNHETHLHTPHRPVAGAAGHVARL
jgi:hypothetical protein